MGHSTRKTIVFSIVLVMIVSTSIAAMLWFSRAWLLKIYRPLVVQYVAATLSAEDKAHIREQIGKETPSLWDSVPEPLVGRVARSNIVAMQSYAEIRTNNAGMRASHPYLPKTPDHYRIACLGDSFIFGEAGKEEDRWCDQLQHWFADTGTTINGKTVETVALGVSSWTMLQEATYMTSRLTDYDPDLIIVLTVSNDITDDTGVTSTGVLTSAFSQSGREWGSGTLVNTAGYEFGQPMYTALVYDETPTAQQYWAQGMGALKRLAVLQKQRRGSILLSILNEEGNREMYFDNLFKAQSVKAGIDAPVFTVTYLKSERTMLPHDSHPNREGYALLTAQYLYAMVHAGIFTPSKPLPMLEESLKPVMFDASDAERKQREKQLQQGRRMHLKKLHDTIAFDALAVDDTLGFLGGILPDREHTLSRPWGSVRSGFVLKPSSTGKKIFVLEIEIPDRTELFPLQVTVKIHGATEKQFVFAEAGKQKLEVPVEDALLPLPALEVMLYTNHYFTQIDDPRMKTYQLLSAYWE